ncbi:MAG: TonB-dependent receptor [Alphaproteobacteria bacterium]|nr:TonB-dependent receptor [Alphaproteobacteria bacterium]MDE2265612.1 TonB-dependent receptor [Alphaproteobacteria bacterium]
MKSKLKLCTHTAIAALLFGAGGAALAQTDQGAMETVVVTGFRESLATALAAKQNSNLIMESVVAEDIGKMPDQDVAESLQRLPGVQINRDQGKGSTVLIDGLRQNLTTLNGDIFLTGKEFYTYGEASGGGSGANIQYGSLSSVPSEEIGGIDVYKSPSAALTEGGMGGIINLKTRDPLTSPDGLSVTADLRGTSTSYQSLGSTTPNATLVASYKPTSTLAIIGSVSYNDTTTRTREMEAYNRSPWVITSDGVKGYTGTGPLNATNGETSIGTMYLLPEYMYWSNVIDQDKTTGASAGVTWAPSNAITTSLVWFFSHDWDRTTNYSNKIGFNGGGSTSNVPGSGAPGINADSPYTIGANGVVQSATFYVTGAETATLVQVNNSDANNLQWHTSFDNGGPITATFDVAYSRATSKLSAAQEDIEHGYYSAQGQTASAAPTAPGCNNFGSSCTVGNPAIQVQYANGGDSGLPTAKYIGAYADVLSNPNYALFKSAWAWANQSKQEQHAIRGAVTYKPSFLAGVEGSITGGFRIGQRDVWQTFGRYLINGLDVNGNYISNCCYAQGNGPGLYYQDPGYAAIPYDTAVSNPSLALTVNNFMFGNMIVKNPVTGGLNNPATFYNTIWNQAANVPTNTPSAVVVNGVAVPCGGAGQPAACTVPAKTKVPNNSEAFYPDTLSSFNVHESTQAFYLMSDLGNKDKGFHLNAGVRVVLTNLVVNGATSAPTVYSSGTATWNGVNSNNVPFTAGHYTVDILPSINLALYPTDDQIVRLSAARVMSPADLFALGLGQSYNFTRGAGCAKGSTVTTGTPGTTPGCNVGYEFANGSSGNPNLDPYRATQFNVSWEDYFAPQALVSVGGFYKQIESFEVYQPVQTTVMDDFGGTTGPITMPVNGGHGQIYGLEFAGQYVLDMGLGVAANYTYTQSESVIQTAFSKHLPIPGVAAHAATATVFYENYGFDARLSYSWRSSTVNGTIGGSTFSPTNTVTGTTPAYGVFTAPIGQLDGQVLYNFTDYLSAYVGAQNLTNEANHMYLQFKDQPFVYDNTGTRYFFGVRFHY